MCPQENSHKTPTAELLMSPTENPEKLRGKKDTTRYGGPRMVALPLTSFLSVFICLSTNLKLSKSSREWSLVRSRVSAPKKKKVKGRNIFYYVNEIVHKFNIFHNLHYPSEARKTTSANFSLRRESPNGMGLTHQFKSINVCPTPEWERYYDHCLGHPTLGPYPSPPSVSTSDARSGTGHNPSHPRLRPGVSLSPRQGPRPASPVPIHAPTRARQLHSPWQ